MKTWNWIQPGDRVWKVISDHEKGIIQVFDEDGNLLITKRGLSEEAIKLVEKSFLRVLTKEKSKTNQKEKTLKNTTKIVHCQKGRYSVGHFRPFLWR